MKISDLSQEEKAAAAEVMSYALGAIKFALKRVAAAPRGVRDVEGALRVVQGIISKADLFFAKVKGGKPGELVTPAHARDAIRNLFAELADDDAQEDAAARAKFSEARRAMAAERFGVK